MSQIEMVDLDSLLPSTHPYRQFQAYLPHPTEALADVNQLKGVDGYGVKRLFCCLLLQFIKDLSDQDLERYLEENLAAKWFCAFTLSEPTPDYSLFTRIRTRIGPTQPSQLFATMREQLKAAGLMSEVFTFVDATHLIAKATLWEERDKVRQQQIEKLNNEVLPKVAVDTQARIGCNGKKKYWYGYKEHVSVDMQSGLINKVATTPANRPDAQGLRHVCPTQGAVYADKGYCTAPAHQAAAQRRCHLAAIQRNNMKTKNRDRDRWYTHLRSPYERVFAQRPKRVRYRGMAKNQSAAFLQAMAFTLKRLLSWSLHRGMPERKTGTRPQRQRTVSTHHGRPNRSRRL
ncbi:MAG: transposase [Nitrospirales bacterium]|nr:transposase [Nitrospirales bacterium]